MVILETKGAWTNKRGKVVSMASWASHYTCDLNFKQVALLLVHHYLSQILSTTEIKRSIIAVVRPKSTVT